MDFLCKLISIPAVILSKVPGIGPIVKTCCTSVGQKILMALTGLALVGFLIAHLAGNLLLYAGEEQFNEYAHKLHSLGPVLWGLEVGLAVTFLAHMGLALSTAAMSRRARSSRYAVTQSKQEDKVMVGGGAANWMLPTGLIVLVFLVLHIADMKFNLRTQLGLAKFEHGEENLFEHVKDVLSDPVAFGVYITALACLGVHLSHGISSALQTLGINHTRWNGLIRFAGAAFGWLLTLGFISLLFWGLNASLAGH